ncbi:MAG: hypothetical protein Q9195_007194 [Heterodermia aff. obscurata]
MQGTNTDAVLLSIGSTAKAEDSIVAWHKTATSPDITSGIGTAIQQLLKQAPVDPNDIICVTLGTTVRDIARYNLSSLIDIAKHFINAILECDAEKLERVGVIRLASQGFTQDTPPFVNFGTELKNVISGGHVIVDGGLQVDGSEIGSISREQILQACEQFQRDNVRDIVVCGVYSPIANVVNQEKVCQEIIVENFELIQVHCSCDVGGLGILQRENAAILNASVHAYASVVFGDIENALRHGGLQGCPLFISSNDGSMIPRREAARLPIQTIGSGPANALSGVSYLKSQTLFSDDDNSLDDSAKTEKLLVLDVGGTSTDAGVLMMNGSPRQASAYTAIAGVEVNCPLSDVSSIGLGGGSIVKRNAEGIAIEIGPESIGNELTTKALCFGGNVLCLTDIAAAAGHAPNIGTVPLSLAPETISSAQALIIEKFEELIASTKTQSKPLPVAIVGGGAVICPEELYDGPIMDKTLTLVVSAVGAACSQLNAAVDMIFETSSAGSSEVDRFVSTVTERAKEKCVKNGALEKSVRLVERQVTQLAYVTNKIRVYVKVAGNIDATSMLEYRKAHDGRKIELAQVKESRARPRERQFKMQQPHPGQDERLVVSTNLLSYHPKIKDERWILSAVDIDWLSIGCYILGCGGGGSPHLSAIAAKQLLLQGRVLTIVNAQDLLITAILPPICLIGSPMVSVERPGGNLCQDALDNMLTHQGLSDFDASICFEIGGSNGLSPLLASRQGREDRPMVDGDLMGRAFPTFEMITPYIHDEDINHRLPVSLASGTGTNMILNSAQNTMSVDRVLRACCETMGCEAGVVSRPMTAYEFAKYGLLHTHSAAWRIGRAVKTFHSGGSSEHGTVAEAIIEQCGGPGSAKLIFEGKIVDVSNRLVKGHSIGQLIIEGSSSSPADADPLAEESAASVRAGQRRLRIIFKNENLIAEIIDDQHHRLEVLATVPTLITVLDSRTGMAIGAPEYRYGLRVNVIAIAASPKWTSPRGLHIAGPRHFGYVAHYS